MFFWWPFFFKETVNPFKCCCFEEKFTKVCIQTALIFYLPLWWLKNSKSFHVTCIPFIILFRNVESRAQYPKTRVHRIIQGVRNFIKSRLLLKAGLAVCQTRVPRALSSLELCCQVLKAKPEVAVFSDQFLRSTISHFSDENGLFSAEMNEWKW